MNIRKSRDNMINNQIRACNINDPYIINTFKAIPREYFVPSFFYSLAFSDTMIPLSCNEYMLTPIIEAKMLQILSPKSHEIILEIGTGSGFFTALLAYNCKHVYSIEIFDKLKKYAEKKLLYLNFKNITLELGNASIGWYKNHPYDKIIITAALPSLSDSFKTLLNVNGEIIAPLGNHKIMSIYKILRNPNGEWENIPIFETFLPYIKNILE